MIRPLHTFPLLIALALSACATSQPVAVTRSPLSLTVVSDDAAFWQKAADEMHAAVPEYKLTVNARTGDAPIHNQIGTG
ncbi:MAG: hypothetical protein II180_03740, partial [Proteobacteria bacterium]|nr:hypothetical protein [Pseudomonadota bacterium]